MRIKERPEDFVVTESFRFEEDPKGPYRVYHSARTVGRRLVIRVTRPIAPELVETLSREFAAGPGPSSMGSI